MNSRFFLRLALISLTFVSTPISASSIDDTNQASLAIPPPVPNLELPPPPSDAFVRRVFEEMTSSDSRVFDRFTGPAPKLDWTLQCDRYGYHVLDRWNSAGANMFTSIGVDSLRTVAIDLLPLDHWADFWQGHLLNFIAGAIGNTDERHIDLMSSSYSAVRYSWESANEGSRLNWGIRPWGTSPYLYFIAQGGHLNGRSLVTLEGRAQYTVLGSTKLEGRLTFQLPASFRLGAATSIDPSCIGSHCTASIPRIAVTLERTIRRTGATPDGVFFLGFRSGGAGNLSSLHTENRFVAGLSKNW